MQKVKQLIKRLLPKSTYYLLVTSYHLFRGILANLINGFPAWNMKVVGVTGTNGKTTAANYIANILEASGQKVGLSTTALFKIGQKQWDNTLNMTTTNPFALQKLLRRMKAAKVDWVVLETTAHGISQHRIFGIPFRYVLVTNLSQDHLDYFDTMANYAAAKAKLVAKAKRGVILNQDDTWFKYFKKQAKKPVVTYGVKKTADVRLINAELSAKGSKLKINYGAQELLVKINLLGKFNAYNALAATATSLVLGMDQTAVIHGLESLESVPGRMENVKAGQPFGVLVDYAHTPDALQNVFTTLRPLTKGKLIAVFGATGDRDAGKRPKMGEIAARLCDVVIITDDEPYTENAASIRHAVIGGIKRPSKAKVIEVPDREEAITKALDLAKAKDAVAILGMGHQKYRVMNSGKVKWDDRAVTKKLLKKL